MKKLTAGIFTVLMGLVSVNAADAAVASKGYVDKLDRVQGALVATNTANIATNTANIATNTANIATNTENIAENAEKIGNATFTDDALKYIKGEADLTAAVKKLDAAVTVASGDLSNVYTKTDADAKFIDTTEIEGYATDAELTGVSNVANAADTLSKTNKDAITLLNSDENTGGSVAEKIKNATTAITTAYQAADTTTLNSAKAYTDALANGAVATNTAEIASINNDTTGVLATAKKYADDQDTAQTTTITNAYKAADAETLNTAKGYTDTLANGAVATNTAAITKLDGDVTVEGSVKKQIQVASDATKTAYEAADAETLETAQGYADAVGTAAKDYAKTYTDQKVAGLNLAEISRVPAACGTPGNYCTLTTNGTNFVWEVIARGDAADEEAPSIDAGSDRLQVTVPGVTEPTVTQ